MSLQAHPINQNQIGFFRTFVQPPGGQRREITLFRNAPVVLENVATADPFTETTASITLPQVTLFDVPGAGDLDWLVADADVDIVWQNTGDLDINWRWEGFITSYDFTLDGSSNSFRLDLKGALLGLDHYIAKPFFPTRPVPYEILIARAFDQTRYPCGLGDLKVTFPPGWDRKVPEFDSSQYPSYAYALKPVGVSTGQNWTGLVSRNTGSFDPVLTGHVQGLLTLMFEDGSAQWTIRNNGYRSPELFLRRPPSQDDQGIYEITLGAPGVSFSGSRDFSQRANTIYGQGKDEAGITFSGLEVTPDGTSTYFKPYAWTPLVYPKSGNPALDKAVRGKETMIRFTDGLNEVAAGEVARSQLQRFLDPGITGTITLTTDPLINGRPFPRMLIKAGTTFRVYGLFGISEGLLVHITQSQVNFSGLQVALTFDSKYRDALTVDEVQARTRDALAPLRALQTGKFSNTLQDLMKPWNYRNGSGMIPQGAATFFNDKLPNQAEFPYESWTKRYPPSKYPQFYLKIGPTNTTDSTKNWTAQNRNGKLPLAIPILMAQTGSIRLSQIAAYDQDGNVMPVRFHASVYQTNGVGPRAMPAFWKDPDTNPPIKFLKPKGVNVNYGVGQSNPFFEGAWEEVTPEGLQYQHQTDIPRGNSTLMVGWGNYYEPAGYSPGRASRGADRTGLLVDETSWSWDNSQFFDKQAGTPQGQDASMLYLLIFCDEQGNQPVYFQGRFIRTEPGPQ